MGPGFGFWGEGQGAGPWALGEDSFLGRPGAGEECRLLALEESALVREREGFPEPSAGTGEEGDVLEREDSWLAKTDLPFCELPPDSAAPLELGGFWGVLSGPLESEPGWPGALASLTGELSTESLWST